MSKDPTQDSEELVDESAAGEEPSAGVLPPNDELEAALREATETVGAKKGPDEPAADAITPDKLTIQALSEELQALREQHATALKEQEEGKDRFLRLQAEFENFRRRGLKERQNATQFGHQNLVKDLLGVVDNLERAVTHTTDGSEGADLQSLLQGVDLVLKEMLGVLQRHGVKVIEAEGLPFDPSVHEAMAQFADDSVPVNQIVQVLQKGYQLHDRMLRPARVVVSKASEEAEGGGEAAQGGEPEASEG